MSLFGAVADSYAAAGASPGSGYAASVIGHSPWGFWELTESSGALNATWADSSGNGRTATITGAADFPTMQQTGPSSFMPGVLWGNTDSASAGTATNFNFTTGTVEAWVYLTGAPTIARAVAACQNNNGGSFTKALRINADGTASFLLSGSTAATTASAVSLNTWLHMVGSVGAAGTKLRINKSTVATLVNTTSTSSSLSGRIGGKFTGGTNTSGAVLTTAAVAIWSSQLTDAQTDAHYDAMFA